MLSFDGAFSGYLRHAVEEKDKKGVGAHRKQARVKVEEKREEHKDSETRKKRSNGCKKNK